MSRIYCIRLEMVFDCFEIIYQSYIVHFRGGYFLDYCRTIHWSKKKSILFLTRVAMRVKILEIEDTLLTYGHEENVTFASGS